MCPHLEDVCRVSCIFCPSAVGGSIYVSYKINREHYVTLTFGFLSLLFPSWAKCLWVECLLQVELRE